MWIEAGKLASSAYRNRFAVFHAIGRQAWFPLSFDAAGAPTLNAPDFAANGGDWTLDLRTGGWNSAPASLARESMRFRGSRAPSLSIIGKSPLRYELAEAALVTITLLASDGKLLGVLERGPKPAGAHILLWNGPGGDGAHPGSGVPLLRLQAGAAVVTVPAPHLHSR